MGKWDIPARREMTDTELRFNPYHDPQNGRFTTAGGGGGGGFLYSKGGKSAYVFERDIDSEYEAWKASKSGSKRELDKNQIRRVNAQNSIFYDAGSAISRKYDSEYDEIGKLNLSDKEKATARDKIYEYSAAELQARQGYFDLYTAGPARKAAGSDKAFDKAYNISNEHNSYMKSLRNQSEKNAASEKEKAFTSAFDIEAAKANASGSREISVNGENWFRTTKSSKTWTKGTLKEYQAQKRFLKSQQNLFIGDRKVWSDLSDAEKSKWY